jgi:hypothetical protein
MTWTPVTGGGTIDNPQPPTPTPWTGQSYANSLAWFQDQYPPGTYDADTSLIGWRVDPTSGAFSAISVTAATLTAMTSGSAAAAAASAAAALASQNAAATSATNAATSAGNASTSATNSSSSATLAQAWAAQPSGVVNGTAWYSALYYSQQASASATAAAGSATAASTSAGNASTSAGNASTSAGNAASSATLAQAWASQASGVVNGTAWFSALYYAQQAAASATAAANSAASIALPLAVTSGGTGSTTAAAARTALGVPAKAGDTFTGSVTVSPASGDGAFVANSVAGSTADVYLQSAGSNRWGVIRNNATESGSNAGSNFQITRYSDAGASIDNPLVITRSTGVAAFTQRPTFAGNTPWDSGNMSAAALSGRNRIINGACTVQQRNSIAIATTAGTAVSGYGGPDRYRCVNIAGGTVTQSASTLTYGGVTYFCVQQQATAVMTNNAGTNYWSGINQLIEGVNSYDLVGQPVAVSFLFQASVTGTYSVAVVCANYSYVTTINVTVANTAQKYTVLVPAIPAAAAIPNTNGIGLQIWIGGLSAGSYITTTLNAWQSGTFITATGTANWGLTANATIAATLLQVEAGTIATPFEFRQQKDAIAQCERYYQNYGTYKFWLYSQNAGVATGNTFGFPMMRASPTVAYSASSITNASGMTFEAVGPNYFSAYASATAAGQVVAQLTNMSLSAEY